MYVCIIVCVCACVCSCACAHVCVYVCVCACTCAYVCVCVCANVYESVCVYACSCVVDKCLGPWHNPTPTPANESSDLWALESNVSMTYPFWTCLLNLKTSCLSGETANRKISCFHEADTKSIFLNALGRANVCSKTVHLQAWPHLQPILILIHIQSFSFYFTHSPFSL